MLIAVYGMSISLASGSNAFSYANPIFLAYPFISWIVIIKSSLYLFIFELFHIILFKSEFVNDETVNFYEDQPKVLH